MSKLLPITIFSLIMAALSHNKSSYEISDGNFKVRHEKIYWVLMAVAMVLFVGLRTAYNDTFFYRFSYINYVNGNYEFGDIDWNIGLNPGYKAVSIFLKSVGTSVQSYLMFFSGWTLIPYCWFIRKYSVNFLFSIFLIFTMGIFTFTLAAIKQCVAVSLALVGIDREIKGKHFRFAFWIIISALFHPYTLLFLIIPFLTFEPWKEKTWLLLFATAIIGFSLNLLLGNIVSVTTMIGEELTEESLAGEGVNFFRFLVIWSPLVLSFHCRQRIWEEKNKVCNLFLNLSFVNGMIMFIALFGTANYFARLANYFLIFQVLALPWIISLLPESEKKIILPISVAGYSAYFFYANVINQHFDSMFRTMTLFEYIKSGF